MAGTAVLDIDGTLVDTNYQHALARYRAFRRFDLTVPLWRIHRAIGMGGDQLITAVAGEEVESKHGDALRDGWTEEYAPMLAEVQPFEDARQLLTSVRDRGFTVVPAAPASRTRSSITSTCSTAVRSPRPGPPPTTSSTPSRHRTCCGPRRTRCPAGRRHDR